MAKNKKSESLFSNANELKKTKSISIPKKSPEEIKKEREKIKNALKNDYLFKSELKDKTEKELYEENKSIIHELKTKKEFGIKRENELIKKINERKKRHYSIDGSVIVYCYLKEIDWPHIVIKPLTISLKEDKEIPSLGPFDEKQKEMLLKVKFKPITLKIKRQIDHFITEVTDQGKSNTLINMDEYKRLAFLCCFDSWNLEDCFERENGKIKQESIEKMHPRILDIVSNEFIKLNEISSEEIDLLEQQSERIFSKGSKGINNPSEGIKLYCEATALAKEFYLSGADAENLPYRISTMMRFVVNKENEIHNRQMDQESKKHKKGAKVA